MTEKKKRKPTAWTRYLKTHAASEMKKHRSYGAAVKALAKKYRAK